MPGKGRFSTRLILAFVVLILLTTVSAGVPAYWLAGRQLRQQAWSQVENAQQATLSLLQAEQSRLLDLATLFAERPTLQRLASASDVQALQPYLSAFQQQSDLDYLIFCDRENRPLAATPFTDQCPAPDADGYMLIDGQPALLASQTVRDEQSQTDLGRTIAGRWLDEAFLRQLAADTGVQQELLRSDGHSLASSLGDTALAWGEEDLADGGNQASRPATSSDGRRFYTAITPLPVADGQTTLLWAVALPVDNLVSTERSALLILGLSTGLVAVLGAALGVWYVRQLAAPLQHLTEVAERVSAGDLTAPIPALDEPLEVSALAGALRRSQASMLNAIAESSRARDWLNTLVQSIAEGVVTYDPSGKISFFNQGAETMTGLPASDALDRPLNDVFRLVDSGSETFLDRLPPPGHKRQLTVSLPNGRNCILAVTGAQLASDAGSQAALVLRDVTQEEAARHLRAYFLANISHEFRTPLSTLNASMEILLDEAEDLTADEMRQLLKPTFLSLRGLQTLVDNLLESSSIEAGRFSIHPRPTDLDNAIGDALRLVHPLLERRRQRLSLVEPTDFPTVQVDPLRLTQVLVNLLSNASKYSPPGQPIDLVVEQCAERARVSVADRGPGIPAAERANLFGRFVRLGAGDGEQYGIGLGLYVAKSIVEAHGGHIGVEDRPGGGSVFWFDLPIAGTTTAEQRMKGKDS